MRGSRTDNTTDGNAAGAAAEEQAAAGDGAANRNPSGGFGGGAYSRTANFFGLSEDASANYVHNRYDSSTSSSASVTLPKTCRVALLTELCNGELPTWIKCSGSKNHIKIIVPVEHLVALDDEAKQWLAAVDEEMHTKRHLATPLVALMQVSQKILPLYHYIFEVQPIMSDWSTNTSRNFVPTANTTRTEYYCAEMTRPLLTWLVRFAIPPKKYIASQAHNLVHELWGVETQEDSVAWSASQRHCPEQLFEVVETRWRKASNTSLSDRDISAVSTSTAGEDDTSTAQPQQSATNAPPRPENLGRAARDWLIYFIKHPEVVRYFGGDSIRRLARYWPMQWLMGLNISHGGTLRDTGAIKHDNVLQRLEKALQKDPARFCTENSRPQNIRSAEYNASASAFGACISGAPPVLNLEQVMRVCVDYQLVSMAKDHLHAILMDMIVVHVARHTYYRKFHMCVTLTALCRKVKKRLPDLLSHCEQLAKPSPRMYDMLDVTRIISGVDNTDDNTTGNLGISDTYTSDQPPISIDAEWFRTQLTKRTVQAVGRLCSSKYQGALVGFMVGVNTSTLLHRMENGLFNLEDLNNVWIYVHESHKTEAVLLYGAYRICNQVAFLAQRDGPMTLHPVPPHVRCCSEQLAFLRYALGYDVHGQHKNGCQPFANAQGRGGAGKTHLLELLSHVLGDTRELLVLGFQGSHVANVDRLFPHLRTATMRLFMHKHCMLCSRTLRNAKASMHSKQFTQFAAMVTKLKKRMLANATAWETAHKEENRVAADVFAASNNGVPIRVDEQQRRRYGPEAFTYGIPFECCPLERVKVVVLEEFGMTPIGDAALLLNQLASCCPNLRCIITMGDKHQLYPISPGHIQQSFLEGFGHLQFDHSHRQGEGCLSQLARAMQDGDPDGLVFDQKTALLVECGSEHTMDALQKVCHAYQLSPYNSQIITRTNKLREMSNEYMKPFMYPNALSVLGAQNTPPPSWDRALSAQQQQKRQLQRAAREIDALEKINYKLNIPSLGLCNNGMYIVWCILVLSVKARQLDDTGQHDAYGMPLRNETRRMTMKQWQSEALRAAAFNEQESALAAQIVVASNNGADTGMLQREFYGVLTGVGETMSLAQPWSVMEDAIIEPSEPLFDDSDLLNFDMESILSGVSAELDEDNVNMPLSANTSGASRLTTHPPLPRGLFNTNRPSLDDGPGTRALRNVKIQLPRTALVELLKAIDGPSAADNIASNMYDVSIDRVLSTTMIPNEANGAALFEERKRTILLCSPFKDDMDITAQVDQTNLIFIPYCPEMRKLVQPALSVTGHCMQGNQSVCVIFLLPYWCKYDTRNYGYTAITRALYDIARQMNLRNQNKRMHPALIVIGKMEHLRKMACTSEPTRESHTGRLLRMVRDITCQNLTPMDYSASAWLEHEEAGKFGKRTDPFVKLYAEQLHVSEESALEVARIRAQPMDLETSMFDDMDMDDDSGKAIGNNGITTCADDDDEMRQLMQNYESLQKHVLSASDLQIQASLRSTSKTDQHVESGSACVGVEEKSTGNCNEEGEEEDLSWLEDIPMFSPIHVVDGEEERRNAHDDVNRDYDTHKPKRRAPVASGAKYRVDYGSIGDPYEADKSHLFFVDVTPNI